MTTLTTKPASQPATPGPRARPRSYLARVMLDLLGAWGARIGLAWIGFLVLLAVFAPYLASSHPIAMRENGSWSSPMLRFITWSDVALLVAFFSFFPAILLRQVSGRKRFWGYIIVVALASVIAFFTVEPPQVVVYSAYREKIETGEIDKAYFTLVPYSPTDRLRDHGDMRLKAPDGNHLMGTTVNGEDLMSRMIHAARIALTIGFIATSIALIIGVTIGGFMGYFSGMVDLLGMRLVEIFSAIPTIYLLIAIVAFYGRNLYLIMVVIGLTSWVGYALFTRAEFLKLREQDFVTAARACGLPLRSILFRHMLPNGIAPVLVTASFGVASAILFESTLSFLGLGLVEEPSWGQMLNQARGVGGSFYWWIGMYPGAAIFLTIFAYNLVGEALRDAIDPHLKKAAQL